MLEGLFYALIGKWGLAAIDFATNNPGLILAVMALWLSVFFLNHGF
jgi:hypothetical protein